jgi:hypothetical protein
MESRHKTDHDLTKTSPSQLALLMGLDETRSLWSDSDHAAIMRHLLDSPIPHPLHSSAHSQTFGHLLQSAHPDVEQLRHVKDFAKSCRTNPQGELPDEVATALYYAAIAAARLSGHRITQLSHAEVHDGITWALSRTWLPEILKHLFQTAITKLPRD